jgi:hypothetical protein
MNNVQRAALPCAATAFLLALAAGVHAQTYAKPADSKPAGHEHAAQGAAASHGELTAVLVDAEKKAMQQAATVKATVKGVAMIDPAQVGEKPRPGQGHLHYQVDDGPVVATTATKLSFHGLKPGTHKIMVVLAANDHTPLGPQQALEVTIPTTASMK